MQRRSLLWATTALLGLLLGAGKPAGCPEPAQVQNCPCGQAEGYVTVKAFAVPLQGGVAEHMYIFTAGTDYLLTACGPEGQPVPLKVTVLDSFHKPVFSNYDKQHKALLPRFGYACGQTGVAHLKLEPQPGAQGCGYLFIGFKPQ